jgi:hypothetical protein
MADWEAIETAYREGDGSVRAIARDFGLSEGAIRKRARQKGWPTRSVQVAGAVQIKVISTGGTQPGTQFRDQNARVRAREGGTHPTPAQNKGLEGPVLPGNCAGWDPASLAQYHRERDRAAAQRTVGSNELVGGLEVTEFKRPRPRGPVLEGPRMGSKHYSPHARWVSSRRGD